ncbi:class I SAM-dependent methyltransferase [Herbidospora yilanensis]|uniref:class I SAM-dependent methyltransferase n=1 Tax=Herbidospora yilanensis TaxID=354426 RepID=UPI0007825BD0|nr:class I SAM-dependent methyltransferase [Herbidospora yilanensis]
MPDFLTETRAGYDALVAEYVDLFMDDLKTNPFDQSVLRLFTDLVPPGKVLEVGCGPGRVTSWLHRQGLDISGVDLSPGMLAHARATFPDIVFTEGDMRSLDVPDASLSGLVAWYSIIHIPAAFLPGVLAEFRRVLAPGGLLLVAFQVGDEILRLRDIDFRRLDPAVIAGLLAEAGFAPVAQGRWEPRETERTPQAWQLVRAGQAVLG